jgi:hypothetical protein
MTIYKTALSKRYKLLLHSYATMLRFPDESSLIFV